MPPIALSKEEVDGLFNLVHRSVVVLIISNSINGNEVDFGTGFVVFSHPHKVLICVETKLIKKDKSIDVRFYDGTRRKTRVFMQKTAFRHAVLEVDSCLHPPPVIFSDSEVTRQGIFTVAAVHLKGELGLMTGTVGNPNCKALNESGTPIYRSESTFAMNCPAAGKPTEKQAGMEESKEIAQLIGAAVFDTNGLVIGTVDTADPDSPNLKFAIKTEFFLDKLETYLKKNDDKISLLRGKGGLSKGTGTSRLSDNTSGSSSRKRSRANATPSGMETSKTVCINQVKGNVELLSEKLQRLHKYPAVRREAIKRALLKLVTEESDGAWRSSTASFGIVLVILVVANEHITCSLDRT